MDGMLGAQSVAAKGQGIVSEQEAEEDRQARAQLAAIKPYKMYESKGGHGFTNPDLDEETILRKLGEWNAFADEQVREREDERKRQRQSKGPQKMAAEAVAAVQAAKDQQENEQKDSSTDDTKDIKKQDVRDASDTTNGPTAKQDQKVTISASGHPQESKAKPFAADLLSSRWAVHQSSPRGPDNITGRQTSTQLRPSAAVFRPSQIANDGTQSTLVPPHLRALASAQARKARESTAAATTGGEAGQAGNPGIEKASKVATSVAPSPNEPAVEGDGKHEDEDGKSGTTEPRGANEAVAEDEDEDEEDEPCYKPAARLVKARLA